MATIKSYTDIEQAKKLAKILPLESADFVWLIGHLHTDGPRYEMIRAKGEVSEPENYWPCWSLAALLDVMKEPEIIRNSEGTWLIRVWYNRYPFSIGGYNNPIDACYEMILKLNKLNLL